MVNFLRPMVAVKRVNDTRTDVSISFIGLVNLQLLI